MGYGAQPAVIDETLSTVARELFAAHHEQCFLVLLPTLIDLVRACDLVALYAASFVEVERDRFDDGTPKLNWDAQEYWRWQIVAVTSDRKHIFAGSLSSLVCKVEAYNCYAGLPIHNPLLYNGWDKDSRRNIDTIIAHPLVFEIRKDPNTGIITHDWSFQKL